MKTPRVLLLDIETAPSQGYYFDLWKEGNIISESKSWYILSFAFKWQGEKKTRVVALSDFKGYKKNKENDKELCAALHEKLNEADVVVAHNGDHFDLPKINARLVIHGFNPPVPYVTVDTLKIARRYFKFDSNRLDSLAKYFGIGSKLPHTGTHLWLGCMSGETKSWSLMKKYNIHDVELLEGVYERLRPWAATHPNLNFVTRATACPVCQGSKFQKRGYSMTRTGQKPRLQCTTCGKWSLGLLEKLDAVTIQ